MSGRTRLWPGICRETGRAGRVIWRGWRARASRRRNSRLRASPWTCRTAGLTTGRQRPTTLACIETVKPTTAAVSFTIASKARPTRAAPSVAAMDMERSTPISSAAMMTWPAFRSKTARAITMAWGFARLSGSVLPLFSIRTTPRIRMFPAWNPPPGRAGPESTTTVGATPAATASTIRIPSPTTRWCATPNLPPPPIMRW